ncbi:acetoacetate decarboxylase family protein [Maricurvus nonylphenolicus]|uniref:acetoacetate decarboxylase family protein n=1 Tax=Maricurvus nonylphenolicus TaxID=1008307 RepID=UPI0036F39680
MSLKGFYLPLTPTGNSTLVGTPPWHFSGEFNVIKYKANPEAVNAMLPPVLEPADDPSACSMFFAEYQSCSDDMHEMDDPILAQYKESGIMIPAKYKGKPVSFCAFIWTTKDFSVARGYIQGYPKHLGEIEMTRVYNLGKATPQLEEGGRFVSTLGSKGRRIVYSNLELTKPCENVPSPFGGPPANVRLFPKLDNDSQEVCELVRVNNRDIARGDGWEANATLKFSEDAGEDILALAPISVDKGYRFSMAFTVDGGTLLERFEYANRY